MAEGTYEYECMRAELLGVDKPDYDEYLRRQQALLVEALEEEQVDIANLKQAEADANDLKSTAGKLEELNNLLSLTQKKINNFKFRCGFVTNYVRTRIGSLSSGSSTDASADLIAKENEQDTTKMSDAKEETSTPRKSDLANALDDHVDKLDLLLEKSEKAHYSMQEQRKQMQRYLK